MEKAFTFGTTEHSDSDSDCKAGQVNVIVVMQTLRFKLF